MLRVALVAASALALAACGGKNHNAQRAVDQFNSGDAPGLLHDFVQRNEAVSSCRIATQPEGSHQLLLTVIAKTGGWLQATIDPNQPLGGDDVTTGGGFDAKTAAELSKNGAACKVSAADGTLALD